MDISTARYALIGDLVGSRRHPDRAAAQRSLVAALDDLNRFQPGLQPLQPTVGDEFQGAYRTLGEALLAAVLIRLSLPEGMDCRAGIGWGSLAVLDDARAPLLQDGPAWWAARDAIGEAAGRAERARFSFLRTWFVVAAADPAPGEAAGSAAGPVTGPVTGPAPGPVNAFLLCRDQMVDRLSVSSRTLLRSALLGQTQEQMAREVGISQSAVSQRLARSGVQAIKEAHDVMTEGVG